MNLMEREARLKSAMKIKNVFRRNKAFTCSKSTMETPEQCVKSVQS